MAAPRQRQTQMQPELEELRRRLQEAEDTLAAIRSGEIDALVVNGPSQQQIYTLKSTDYTYRMLIESMSEGAITISPSGLILYSNARFGEILSLPLEKVIGTSFQDLIYSPDNQKFEGFLKKMNQPLKFELRLSANNGKTLDVILSANKINFGEDEPVISCIITDLTKLNKAKDEFISLASHQLRTPATAVKQYIGMLLDGYLGELAANQRDALTKAYDSNERELTVINDLLKIAQVDAGKVTLRPAATDMLWLVQDIVDGFVEKITIKKITVEVGTNVSDMSVQVDPMMIRSALENLIDNAIKYSPRQTAITIQMEKTKTFMTIRIIDQGLGIAPQDQMKLFKKFSRVENAMSIQEGGSGVGLYWVKKVVDLHGGTISVEPNLPRGTVFTMKLPRTNQA